ncbi:MAG: hypothetical protein JXR77_07585 [Lentisphaeria bacterium]|nr:hypothetical protein [Lentisphaeria bacterium]
MATPLAVRELYCPSHFGNEYECAREREMTAVLREARYWGYNRYSDWFDTIDLGDVYRRGGAHFNLPEAMWARKFEGFAAAARLGFDLGLVVTPNHVFADQVTAANRAVTGPRMFGQLVCPAKPGVVELVRANYRNLFRDFAARGLRLTAVSGGAYDYGGCACDGCAPWIVSFGRLFLGIVEEAEAVFGPVCADLWAWWWSDEDHRLFTQWADREAPGRFSGLAHHILYGESRYAERPQPAGCGERAFTHIGYGETGGIDVYGHYGPVVAPRRLEATARFLVSRGATGFLAYSEGTFDEANKAILGALTAGRCDTAREALMAYAERCLGGDADGWADWLTAMGDVERVDPNQARRDFDRLARQTPTSECRRMWEGKLRLREADANVRVRQRWTAARLVAAEEFWTEKEFLWRNLWRRGLGRSVFRFDWKVPPWHAEYARWALLHGAPAASPPPPQA